MMDQNLERSLRLAQSLSVPLQQEDRRVTLRYRTVYRVAPAYTMRDSGLARVRNISDGGMALEIAFPVCLGDEIVLALSDEILLSGRVGWSTGTQCGVRFDNPIDSIMALRQSADAARGPRGRAPRMRLTRTALTNSLRGVRVAEVLDVSQRGMKLAHDGSFTPGLRVQVRLSSGVERGGVVRWSQDGLAGLMLTDTFTPQELGSLRAI